RLISDLRDLSLAETGQLPLQRRPTNLNELVRVSVARFASRAGEKDVRLEVEAADGLPKVEADPDRLSQILGNLLDNALRYTPASGEVVVRLEAGTQPGTLQATVCDTGPGIPEEHLPNVFERFYRADRARTRTNGGSGLGLAVVKQLVEAHGGRVWAESQRGMGATFGFVLPAAGEPGAPTASRFPKDDGWYHNGSA
nr:cell wall metabolism sensor histidine kinase WalK [Actinomycetota bacterium]